MAKVIYEKGWRRIGAFIIDMVIIAAAAKILLFILSGNVILEELEDALILLGGWLYYSMMESSRNQGTLGKMTVGIKVTDEAGSKISFGRATARYFAKILSALILFIGFLMIFFTEKGQGLHDKIAKCVVIRANS